MTTETPASVAEPTEAPYKAPTFEEAIRAFNDGAPEGLEARFSVAELRRSSRSSSGYRVVYRTDWAALSALLGAAAMMIASLLSWGELVIDVPGFEVNRAFNAFDQDVDWAITGGVVEHGWVFTGVAFLVIYAHWVRTKRLLAASVVAGLVCAWVAIQDYADIEQAALLTEDSQASIAVLTGGLVAFEPTAMPMLLAVASLVAAVASMVRMNR